MFRLRLKELRESKGLSQYKLAEELNVSQARIGHWEAGTRECDFNTLGKLAKYFNVSVDYLLGLENSTWTAEDYKDGDILDTVKVSVMPIEHQLLYKFRDIKDLAGKQGQNIVIEFEDLILERFGK